MAEPLTNDSIEEITGTEDGGTVALYALGVHDPASFLAAARARVEAWGNDPGDYTEQLQPANVKTEWWVKAPAPRGWELGWVVCAGRPELAGSFQVTVVDLDSWDRRDPAEEGVEPCGEDFADGC